MKKNIKLKLVNSMIYMKIFYIEIMTIQKVQNKPLKINNKKDNINKNLNLNIRVVIINC